MMKKIKFNLPPKGSLKPNTKDDPLKYYYKPLLGYLYCRRIQKALNLLNPPYESILEVGYGSGLLFPSISKICKKMTGIDKDSNPEEVSNNLKKLGCRPKLVVGNVLKMKFPKESFDLIIAISIFEHIKDTEKVSKELYRVLKPGGELLVGMPRVDKIMEKLFHLIGCKNISEQHVTTYKEFLKTAKKQFRLVKFSKMPSFLPAATCIYFNMLFKKES